MAAAGLEATALSGSLMLALPIAALAGAVSFFSPCVLPLVPGYLSYVTGVSGADLAEARRGRILAGTLLFLAGFTAVFVSFGAAFGYAGNTLLAHQEPLIRILGALTIVMRLSFMGVLPCAGSGACTGVRRSGWPGRRCWACSSASAGRRASAPPGRSSGTRVQRGQCRAWRVPPSPTAHRRRGRVVAGEAPRHLVAQLTVGCLSVGRKRFRPTAAPPRPSARNAAVAAARAGAGALPNLRRVGEPAPESTDTLFESPWTSSSRGSRPHPEPWTRLILRRVHG